MHFIPFQFRSQVVRAQQLVADGKIGELLYAKAHHWWRQKRFLETRPYHALLWYVSNVPGLHSQLVSRTNLMKTTGDLMWKEWVVVCWLMVQVTGFVLFGEATHTMSTTLTLHCLNSCCVYNPKVGRGGRGCRCYWLWQYFVHERWIDGERYSAFQEWKICWVWGSIDRGSCGHQTILSPLWSEGK